MAQVHFAYSKLRDWGPLTTESMVPGKLYTVERKDSYPSSLCDIVLATTPFKGQAVGGFANVAVAVRLDAGSFVVADKSPVYRVTEIEKVTLISED